MNKTVKSSKDFCQMALNLFSNFSAAVENIETLEGVRRVAASQCGSVAQEQFIGILQQLLRIRMNEGQSALCYTIKRMSCVCPSCKLRDREKQRAEESEKITKSSLTL